jgi:hypothetical protein
VLVQAGKKEDLIIQDNTGFTPAQLAADKSHRQVAFFLVGTLTCINTTNNMEFQHSQIVIHFFVTPQFFVGSKTVELSNRNL